jgi:hypothetical protein
MTRPGDPNPLPGHDDFKGNTPGRYRPGTGRDRDRDRRDRDRDRDRDRWRNDQPNYQPNPNWNYGYPNTVIVDRPVYVPFYNGPYNYYNYDYNRYYNSGSYYYDREYEAWLDELEVIARQIKTALRLDPDLGRFNLDTDTVGESIEIEGTVDRPYQLQLVLDVARSISDDVRIVITRVRIR